MKDPDFLADGERQKVTVTALTGEEIEKKINDLYTLPKRIIERANALMTRQ